jgi:hypothetical protein
MALTLQGCSKASSDDGMKNVCNLKSAAFKVGYEAGFVNNNEERVFSDLMNYIHPEEEYTEHDRHILQVMAEKFHTGYVEGQSMQSWSTFAPGTDNFKTLARHYTTETCMPYVDEFLKKAKY